MLGIYDKRVLILGGCGDIGQAIAHRFVQAGALVVLADRLPVERGRDVASSFESAKVSYVYCDAGSQTHVLLAMQQSLAILGGLDVAIACAGAVSNAPFLQLSDQSWHDTLKVNLTGSFYFGQAAANAMLRNPPRSCGRRGTILFTGSWVQQLPWPEGASYCVSKAGQEMLMKVMAQELAAHQITCNVVSPGVVYAGLSKTIYDRDEQYRSRVNQTVPLGRLSTAAEVAGAFLFLASDDGAYVTGTTFLVDGGASLVRRDTNNQSNR